MNYHYIKDLVDLLRVSYSTEDAVDIYLHKFLPILYVAIAIYSSLREYFFNPIVCWIPKTWITAYDEFTRDLCWSDSTYFMKDDKNPPKTEKEINLLKLNYYQWIFLLLLAMAIIIKTPNYLWMIFCKSTGIDIDYITKLNVDFSEVNKSLHDKTIKYIVTLFQRLLIKNKVDKVINTLNLESTKKQGRNKSYFSLIVIYLFVRFCYFVVILGLMGFLKVFLGMDSYIFGIKMLINLRNNLTWEDTGKFPVLTWCRVRVMMEGDEFFKNVQCVLPNNVFNEKIFICIWFTLAIGLVILTWCTLIWCIRLFVPNIQHAFIHKHLYYLITKNKDCPIDQIIIFNKEYIGRNGTFILFLLYQNLEEVTFQAVVLALWNDWQKTEYSKIGESTTL